MASEESIPCVITAGGIPEPGDPLYAYSQGKPKALIEIAGRPMVEWVIRALQASPFVGEIVIAGLAGTGYEDDIRSAQPVHHLPNQGSLVANVLAGIDWMMAQYPQTGRIMLSSADLPALTTAGVNHFIDACHPFDRAIYYTMVTKETIEARYPDSRRTFVPLHDLRIAGGDLFLVDPVIAHTHRELWEVLANGRKHAWKLAWAVGPRVLLRFLMRRFDIDQLEATAERILRRPVKIILTPHAEIGMDVDKPRHLEILEAELAPPTGSGTAPGGGHPVISGQ
jgi:molybdopterin-guanine dinucleotide biosynthesis protein A